MYCPNCGTENNDDAQFCQKCGKSLNSFKKKFLSLKTTIIIIACIGLILTIGLSVGMMLSENKEPSPSNNSTINQTQLINNSTNNTNQVKKQNTDLKISASEAEDIASDSMSGYNLYGDNARLKRNGNGHPIWIVSLYGDETGNNGPPGYYAGKCEVDAITGEFILN